jgi:hypothetical protein
MPRKLPKCKLKKTFLKKQIKNVKNNPLKFSRFNPENPEVIRIYKYKIETWERILSRISKLYLYINIITFSRHPPPPSAKCQKQKTPDKLPRVI